MGKPGDKSVLRSFNQTDSSPLLGTYERRYNINLPAGYTGKKILPVLFYFHGWGDDINDAGELPALANEHNFILVRPVGMDDGQKGLVSWNVGSAGRSDVCNPRHSAPYEYEYTSCKTLGEQSPCNTYTCYDDVKYVSDLFASLMGELCIDEDLVFGVGASNGAMFLYYLIAELDNRNWQPRFDSFFPFYGAFFKNMEQYPGSLRGTSVFAHHGIHDVEIPPAGGESWNGWYYVPIDTTLGHYAALNGCALQQSEITTAYDNKTEMLGCYEFIGCNVSARVVRCNFNASHGFWEPYQEQMLWSFLSSILPSASDEALV